ncbi:MAG: nicotinate (nicotinamide) nucleotide adenylyltransferase [Acidobacteriota bacterium]|nr:nicotinate (nicotinamide) nucleotide adenylyltransferase [Acidobacteriota bacterium]MDQ7087295.1 nicotinate (nicotinamide) nucleotide adenylyltransferase [Acidobacteriota bacterium]
MRIGLFGGTFDPPHLGHLAACRAARDQLILDRLEVVPCGHPPHRGTPRASGAQRLAMVRLTLEGEAKLVASDRELEREGPSFTIQTLAELAAERPGAEIFLVLGGDSYDDLPGWHRHDEIEALAHLAVIARPGAAGLEALRPGDHHRVRRPDQPLPVEGRAVIPLEMEPCPYSASAIRERLARGLAPEGLAPAVLEYIRRHALYTPERSSSGMNEAPRDLLSVIQQTLAARKAENILTLDLRGRCSFADHFVICHGSSDRQVKSLAEEVQHEVRKQLGRKARAEGFQRAEWILLDFGDVIVHVFSESARDFFRLESLWQDAPRLDE